MPTKRATATLRNRVHFGRITGIVALSAVLLYGVLTAGICWVMWPPPDCFGGIMRHVPGVAMAIVPFEPIWMRARAGTLHPGDVAPDFILTTVDPSARVRISEAHPNQPVVLIFGATPGRPSAGRFPC